MFDSVSDKNPQKKLTATVQVIIIRLYPYYYDTNENNKRHLASNNKLYLANHDNNV